MLIEKSNSYGFNIKYSFYGIFSLFILFQCVHAQMFQDQTSTLFPTPPNNYTNQITIGDIDNDDDLDIIFANGSESSAAQDNEPVRLYLNNGSGIFSDVSEALNFRGVVRGVELGDIDND